ncbi:ParB/RepB/Spo0J family partition protein [Amycolatopsis taiwanensis]|uniref:ParB-like N-terminal domain-containing protein n=1 Tax=Amycolatopsis taiwanensis TaxID=342230 RepID=A0A9W6R8W7_9PSEU|nr:ParB/RepB/Spo0J family partition protein [Amycolatopsis taiwanensis]GLY71509.1 hypothetical protein Atai01_81280 [Amycolatopsis taiwanensis]
MLVEADSPRLDGEDEEHIAILAENDQELPPILVHRQSMRVIDGMHRLRAALRRGAETIAAEYFDGTEADAFVQAVRANIGHGLPLSLHDRKAAATRIARSHPGWSDRAIAKVTGLSHKTVAAVRRSSGEVTQSTVRVGRDGRARPVDPVGGRRAVRDAIVASPKASLREVARKAGVSVGTAQKVREQLNRGDDPVPEPHHKHDPGHSRLPQLLCGDTPATGTMPDEQDMSSITRSLLTDPSLRLTECGRELLRLLAVHAKSQNHWNELAEAVPPHRVAVVFKLANEYARAWEDLCEKLHRRAA